MTVSRIRVYILKHLIHLYESGMLTGTHPEKCSEESVGFFCFFFPQICIQYTFLPHLCI